jgi:hypothetical protein
MIDSAAPGKSFDILWAELSAILLSGRKVGKYYGRAFVVSAVTEGAVRIDSPDAGGEVEIPREVFSTVYADWRYYRYEALSHTNTQETLHVVSLINHVVMTWVRREERSKILESARAAAKLRDAVFWIVHYNEHSRHVGPRPSGEPLTLSEVFPMQAPSLLSELELAAIKLFNAGGTCVETLEVEHQGFAPEVYWSVIARNQLSEIW